MRIIVLLIFLHPHAVTSRRVSKQVDGELVAEPGTEEPITVEDLGWGEEQCDDCDGGDILPDLLPGSDSDNASSWLESGRIDKRWADGVVKYAWHSDIDPAAKEAFRLGMLEWEAKTCIHFEEAEPALGVANFSSHLKGCSSHVGFSSRFPRITNLGKGCHHKGSALHELGHMIALDHEHTRVDRDDFLEILEDNIPAANRKSFGVTTGYQGKSNVPYDLGSIMHYGGWAFSIHKDFEEEHRTIALRRHVLKDVWGNCRIGQRSFLSQGDVLTVNRWYGCPDRYCTDVDARCELWAREGKCQDLRSSANCDYSCGVCKCLDKDARCAEFAASGLCPRSRGAVKSDSANSTGMNVIWTQHDGARDLEQDGDWMKIHCSKSCGRCSNQDMHCKDNPMGAWNKGPGYTCEDFGPSSGKKHLGQSWCLQVFFSQQCPETCSTCPAQRFCFD